MQNLVGKVEQKTPFQRRGCGREDDVKIIMVIIIISYKD
jgi:hypothetical protein